MLLWDASPDEMKETGEAVRNVGKQLLERALGTVENMQLGIGDVIWILLEIVAIVVIARLLLKLVSYCTSRVMKDEKYHQSELHGKRVDSIMTLLRSTARYVIYFTAAMMVLGKIGLQESLNSVVFAAGIGGIAIGFGAQNLVKDVVTGFFLMFENQFSVGDFVQIEEDIGTVSATALRVTYLKAFKGEQIIIPNGNISRVINYSRNGNAAFFTVPVSYEANTRMVLSVMEEALDKYVKENPELVEDAPVVQGVREFGPNYMEVGVFCKTAPMKHWQAERGMRLAIKEMFDEKGILFPYPRAIVMEGGSYLDQQDLGQDPTSDPEV